MTAATLGAQANLRVGIEDPTRTVVTWWAPFDRVVALAALTVCGAIPLVWAPVLPVRIVSAVIVATALTKAVTTLLCELGTPAADRGVSITETPITSVFPPDQLRGA